MMPVSKPERALTAAATGSQAALMQCGVANDSAFADLSPADFELRLHQNDHAALRGQQLGDSRDDQRRRNEADVAHGQVEFAVEIRRREDGAR